MIKTALQMLWIERKKTISLCLSITATLCVCLIYLQFFINPYLVKKIAVVDIFLFNENFALTLMGLGILLVCISLIAYACQYFMRIHSRELGLLKLAGYTCFQVVCYQMIQMMVVTLIAMILAYILSIILIPISLFIIYRYCAIQQSVFYYPIQAIGAMFMIVLMIMLVMMAFAIQYNVTSSITKLLKQDHVIGYREDKRALKIPDVVYFIAYILGLYSMYVGETLTPGFAIAALIGVVGAYGMFYYWIPHALEELLAEGKIKGESYVILGNLSLFMQQSKTLIAFIMTSIILVTTFILSSTDKPLLHIALHISAILMNILLSSSLITRFKIDDFDKKGHYHNLCKMGMMKKEVCQISRKEGQYFYGILWFFTGIYMISIFITFYLRASLQPLLAILVLLEYMIPYLLSQIIVYINKRRN